MTSVHTSRIKLIYYLSGPFLLALILGGLGIPIVSSEGMIIRAQAVTGDIPVTPEDPQWKKIAPMTLPLSGQIITPPLWPQPTAHALSVRAIHNGTDIAFFAGMAGQYKKRPAYARHIS